MADWKDFLVRKRKFLKTQMEFLNEGNTRLHETTDGITNDTTADWYDRLAQEYGEISQLLIDAGVPLDD